MATAMPVARQRNFPHPPTLDVSTNGKQRIPAHVSFWANLSMTHNLPLRLYCSEDLSSSIDHDDDEDYENPYHRSTRVVSRTMHAYHNGNAAFNDGGSSETSAAKLEASGTLHSPPPATPRARDRFSPASSSEHHRCNASQASRMVEVRPHKRQMHALHPPQRAV